MLALLGPGALALALWRSISADNQATATTAQVEAFNQQADAAQAQVAAAVAQADAAQQQITVSKRQTKLAEEQLRLAERTSDEQIQVAQKQLESSERVVEARLSAAHKEAEAAEEQAKSLELQGRTAEQSLLDGRYYRGAEALGHDNMSVRLGGVYTLSKLKSEFHTRYANQVIQLLCAFVRNPPSLRDESNKATRLREDVQAAVQSLGDVPNDTAVVPGLVDLRGAELRYLVLRGGNLNRATLDAADLSDAVLHGVELNRASLVGARLTEAKLEKVNLNDAKLSNVNLTGAKLKDVNFTDAVTNNARTGGVTHTDCTGGEFLEA
ncbi:pentapeptide repeat-containing protein [Candidatus Poriferisodalis sp.]|uniref:pentapeptide repeat-containing protein n=1 Tax=Candidatus Poriferisodalis sp. TaxID=3101277 RepID=UPI003B52B051